jgi:hypothetical protein
MNEREMNYQQCFRIPKELAHAFDHRSYWHSPRGMYCGNMHCGNWQLPCPNSKEAENIGSWSAGSNRYQISICGERQNQNGWYTVFGCPYCGNIFALEQEDFAKLELPPYIAERIHPIIPFQVQQ